MRLRPPAWSGADGDQSSRRQDSARYPSNPTGSDGSPIRIGLLGPFQLITPTGRRIKRTATRDLIAYLALHPHGATRDELLEAIWPGGDPRRTRQRLAQSVTEARKLLGEALRTEHSRYSLDHDFVMVDIDEVAGPSDAGTPPPGRTDAGRIVRGVPLGDIDAVWADAHRTGLVTLAQDALASAAHADLARRSYRQALDMAERGLALDELNEALWQILLRAHAGLGARTAVTDSYQRLVATLDRYLGVGPGRDTQILYRELLADDLAPAARSGTHTPSR